MHYRTRSILTIFLLLLAHLCTAQKEDYNWCYAHMVGINFNTNPPGSYNTTMYTNTASASISDASGNLLLYTNGEEIWNRNRQRMPNGRFQGVSTNASLTSTAIVQHPGNPQQYFVFSATFPQGDMWLGIYYIKYSLVDMSLNGGLGDVVPSTGSTLLDSNWSGAIGIAGYGMCDKWLIGSKAGSDTFCAYKITASGVNTTPVISKGLPALAIGGASSILLTNDNRRIVCAKGGRASLTSIIFNSIQLYDFDVNSGILSNGAIIENPPSHQDTNKTTMTPALSPDNSKLYYSITTHDVTGGPHFGIAYKELFQIDLNQPNTAAIKASRILLERSQPYGRYAYSLRTGPGGKVYAPGGPTHLSGFLQPNLLAPFCDFRDSILMFAHGENFAIFPAEVVSNHTIYRHNAVVCDSRTLTAPATGVSYIWSTGATTASITPTMGGTYWVKTITSSCGTRIDTFLVEHILQPHLPDTNICNGQTLVLSPNIPGATYKWQDGSTGSSFTVTTSGKYIVTATREKCTVSDTADIKIYPPSTSALLPPDTVICDITAPFRLKTLIALPEYQWSTNSNDSFILIDKAGKYWVSNNSECGLRTDTINISYCSSLMQQVIYPDTICAGECVRFSVSPINNAYQYKWEFEGGNPGASTGDATTTCFQSPGKYTITLTTSGPGGSITTATNIEVLPAPSARFEDSTIEVRYNTPLTLLPCGNAASLNWYKNDSLICEGCNSLAVDTKLWKSRYACVLGNGTCRDTCNYLITVTDIPNDIWLPSAFSPNGDGLNDFFGAIYSNPNIKIRNLSVFSRWGNKVFYADGNTLKWNGKFNGKDAELGVYFWLLQYVVDGRGSEVYQLKGDVTLVR